MFEELNRDFIIAQNNKTETQLKEYETLTNRVLEIIEANKDESVKKLEIMFREERNTWRLARALLQDQLLTDQLGSIDDSSDERMSVAIDPRLSEDHVIGTYFAVNPEIRRMQLVVDWLEANEASEEDDQGDEYLLEGPVAWENTFYAIRSNQYRFDLEIPSMMRPNDDICSAMDPDAPIRTKKTLVHDDKEIEVKLYKHIFKHVRSGRLDKGQEIAQKVGYHWLAAILDGWLTYSDPNLDDEMLDTSADNEPPKPKPVSGNKKRDVWRVSCFNAARIQGLSSFEKAVLGVYGGNLKTVLPVCNSWSDQLWARIRCSIDVLIERVVRDPKFVPQENITAVDFPEEFYENYQDLRGIFNAIRDLRVVSPFKEATIHQTIQKYFILSDIDGLLNQLRDWSQGLEFDNNILENVEAISPQFLRCFAHLVLLLRDIELVSTDDSRGAQIIEAYIALLTRQQEIESVAHYTTFLPRENQVVCYAKLLASIGDPRQREHCLDIAKESRLDVDDITQTVVELIRNESQANVSINASMSEMDKTKTTALDKRKIDSMDYLLYLDTKNYIAILHNGNILLRLFALQRKMDAVKDTFLKLPVDLKVSVENQWKVHTNSDISLSLRNNIRELESFECLLKAQDELSQWSEWRHKRPEEPKKPADLSKFCDSVNYEQRTKQYQQDLALWEQLQEAHTNTLVATVTKMFTFPGGWMKDLEAAENSPSDERAEQLANLRKIYVPHMITICFSVLCLTERYQDCLEVSHLLANDQLGLYKEFTKAQLVDFLDKISEVTKIMFRKSIQEAGKNGQG